MNIEEFVQHFAEQFDETDTSEFNPESTFRDFDEWSSLTSLSIIAMIDEKYKVKFTGDDIKKSTTIEDIYSIVRTRS